jgi:hypothetical protein
MVPSPALTGVLARIPMRQPHAVIAATILESMFPMAAVPFLVRCALNSCTNLEQEPCRVLFVVLNQ